MDHMKKFGVAVVFVGLVLPSVAMAADFFTDPFAVPPPPGGFDMTAPISPASGGTYTPTAAPGGTYTPTVIPQGNGPTGGSGGVSETITFPNPSPYDTVMEILEAILRALVSILIPIITVMIVYSGYLFVTAGGNEKKLEDAKKMLLGVVIGAALILGAWVLAQAIANTISGLEP